MNLNTIDAMMLFIRTLRSTDRYIAVIYMNGGCYRFHLMLKVFFDHCYPYINKGGTHVITKYKAHFFDINGLVDGSEYRKLEGFEVSAVEQWSFYRNNFIQLSECPNCDEPLLFTEPIEL